MLPDGDILVGWTSSRGSGGQYTRVNSGVSTPTDGSYISALMEGQTSRFSLSGGPSDVISIDALRVRAREVFGNLGTAGAPAVSVSVYKADGTLVYNGSWGVVTHSSPTNFDLGSKPVTMTPSEVPGLEVQIDSQGPLWSFGAAESRVSELEVILEYQGLP